MPALCIESCSQLKSILELTKTETENNWLISFLECYDTEGWDGCEKWNEHSLILTDGQLKKDVYLRNMQIIWGVFSAIPAKYSEKDILAYDLPELDNQNHMSNHIVPYHPLAVMEISVCDGSYTYISAHDENLLRPYYNLPYKIIDAEADNKIMNQHLCRIQDVLRSMIPDVSDKLANEIQWKCYHLLFNNQASEPSDDVLIRELAKAYKTVSKCGYRFSYGTIWNPYEQKTK